MKTTGFSFIELMVAASIVGLLAMIAYPSYLSHVTKTRRAEAMNFLLQDAIYLERFYTENGCYRNKGTDTVCSSSDDTNPTLPYLRSPATGTLFYTISLDAASSSNGSTYTLTADPANTPQANDGKLTLDNTGKRCWDKNPSCTPIGWQ